MVKIERKMKGNDECLSFHSFLISFYMDMQSRNQYLQEFRSEYLNTKFKNQRGKILDEAVKRTKLGRKYLIKKLRSKSNLDKQSFERKKRKREYNNEVSAALVVCWRIFDYLCGQRLKPLLETERLRRQYDTPKTPYQRVIESKDVLAETKTIKERFIF